MDFFAHDKQGRIVMTGNCPSSMLSLQKVTGAKVRIGTAVMGMHYWSKGKGLTQLPPKPSEAHYFDYAREVWELDEAKAWTKVRAKRDELLAATDWRLTLAQERGVALAEEWRLYRQALRDVTQQSDPLAIVWPAPPQT